MPSPYVMEVTDLSTADAIIYRGDQPQAAVRAIDRSPAGKADAVRSIFPEIKCSDELRLGTGVWDHALNQFAFPLGVTVSGRGKGATILRSTQRDSRNHCGFDLTRGCKVKNLTLIWETGDGFIRQGQCCGIADSTYTGPAKICKLADVEIISYGGFGLYFWGAGSGHRIGLERCDIKAGRWGVTLGSGSGDDAQIVDMVDCNVTVDFSLFKGAGGDQGQNSIGICVRGGALTMTGGSVTVRGYAGSGVAGDNNCLPFDRAIGVATTSLGTAGMPKWGNDVWPTAYLKNVRFLTVPNGVKESFDTQQYIGKLTIDNCTGSGPGGIVLTDGPILPVAQHGPAIAA